MPNKQGSNHETIELSDSLDIDEEEKHFDEHKRKLLLIL